MNVFFRQALLGSALFAAAFSAKGQDQKRPFGVTNMKMDSSSVIDSVGKAYFSSKIYNNVENGVRLSYKFKDVDGDGVFTHHDQITKMELNTWDTFYRKNGPEELCSFSATVDREKDPKQIDMQWFQKTGTTEQFKTASRLMTVESGAVANRIFNNAWLTSMRARPGKGAMIIAQEFLNNSRPKAPQQTGPKKPDYQY